MLIELHRFVWDTGRYSSASQIMNDRFSLPDGLRESNLAAAGQDNNYSD